MIVRAKTVNVISDKRMDLILKDTLTIENIKARTEKLVETLMNMFKFPE